MDKTGFNCFKIYQIALYVLNFESNLKISWGSLDKHGLDRHGLDKHGHDKHGLENHDLDKHGFYKHDLDKHGLGKLHTARSLDWLSILFGIKIELRTRNRFVKLCNL